jgi:hypothetical protein
MDLGGLRPYFDVTFAQEHGTIEGFHVTALMRITILIYYVLKFTDGFLTPQCSTKSIRLPSRLLFRALL